MTGVTTKERPVIEEAERLKAESSPESGDIDVEFVCLRGGVAHLYERGEEGAKDCRDRNDWSFAGWVDGVIVHRSAKTAKEVR